MVERITRQVAGVAVDLLLCVCERPSCGWAWVVANSRGVPRSCSRCKAKGWNHERESEPDLHNVRRQAAQPRGENRTRPPAAYPERSAMDGSLPEDRTRSPAKEKD